MHSFYIARAHTKSAIFCVFNISTREYARYYKHKNATLKATIKICLLFVLFHQLKPLVVESNAPLSPPNITAICQQHNERKHGELLSRYQTAPNLFIYFYKKAQNGHFIADI